MPVANEESTPKPDPTVLTTEQVQREIAQLKELMEAKFSELTAILDERRKGVELAEREREKMARVAEQEREKAAAALRGELERMIDAGDMALREHIKQQIAQIREALDSSDKLEIARVEAVTERIEAVNEQASQHVEQLRRERELVTAAQQEAIAKAEEATAKQFAGIDQWRGQSAERERTQQEQLAALTSSFMPREVAEAQIHDLRRTVGSLSDKVNKNL